MQDPVGAWSLARKEHLQLSTRIAKVIAGYHELLLVVLAAVIGLVAHAPLRWIGARHGIDVTLMILVFSSVVTVSAGALDRLRSSRGRIVLTLLAGATVLPALAWAASHVVSAGPLRLGIMALGLAPCEIASIAATMFATSAAGMDTFVASAGTTTGDVDGGAAGADAAGSLTIRSM